MKTLRFLIVIPCCLVCSVVLAQIVTPEEDLDYVITEVTLPGGRLGNNVNAIVQGSYGFLWFGSHGGLHRLLLASEEGNGSTFTLSLPLKTNHI
jgi:hypothetical protein